MSQADLEASLIRGVRIRVLPGKKKGTTRKERRKNADIYTYALHTAREQRCISIPSIDFRHRWTKKPKLGHRSLLSLSPHREIYLSVYERYFVVSLVTISQRINRGGNCFLDERNSSLNRILVREFLSPRAPFNPKNLNHLHSEKSPPSCIFVKLYSRGDI